MKQKIVCIFGAIMSAAASNYNTQSSQLIQHKQIGNEEKLIKIEIKKNRYYTKEAIAMMLKNADLTSIASIKSTLGNTLLFHDIDVEINDSKNVITVTIIVKEKPLITRVAIYSNSSINTFDLCRAVNVYPGALSYEMDNQKHLEEQIVTYFSKLFSFNGLSINYWRYNFCRTVDVHCKNTTTAAGVEMDIYINKKFDVAMMRWYLFYGLLGLYVIGSFIYLTVGWKKFLRR